MSLFFAKLHKKIELYKPAKINDSVEGHFLFDTGADRLSFDQTFYNTSFRNFGSSGFNYGKAHIGGVGTGGTQTVPRSGCGGPPPTMKTGSTCSA